MNRFLRADGSLLWADKSVSCLPGSDSALRCFITQLTDITTQIKAQQALAEQEQRYRLLAENSSDVVVHVRDQWHGSPVIEWGSCSVQSTLGAPPEYWLSRSVLELISDEDLAVYHEARAAMQSGRPVVYRLRLYDFAGQFHWIKAHGQFFLDQQSRADGIAVSFCVVDSEVQISLELEYSARHS